MKREKRRKETERSVEKIATNLEADKLRWNLQRVYSFYRCEGKRRHEDLFLLLFSEIRGARPRFKEHEPGNSHLSNSRRNFQGYNVAQVHVSLSLSRSLPPIVLVKIIGRLLLGREPSSPVHRKSITGTWIISGNSCARINCTRRTPKTRDVTMPPFVCHEVYCGSSTLAESGFSKKQM